MAVAEHHLETSTGLDNRKLMMWLFLASDCLFFGAFIAAYLLYRDRSVVGPYPDELFDIPFTSVSAFILLMSSVSMVLALAAIQRGDRRNMQVWLFTTAILGLLFIAGQAYEFTEFYHEGLTIDRNLFGTTFFVLTGFHGAHVTLGVVILLSLFGASLQGRIQQKDSLSVEIAGLYWHFVDIVWIVIFTLIYLIQP
jgi:heme/copper-type cytochrome/quinol oxidase subunit 3